MRFAVVVFACVLAVANAQFNQGQYFPQQEQTGQYKKYNQYNPYNPYNNQYNNRYNNQYNRYNQYNQNYTPYKPYVTSTPFPVRPTVTVTETPAPVTAVKITSAPVVPVSPVVTPAPVPVNVPVVPIAKVASDARSAETVRYGNEINADGAYSFFYETNNGIAAQAQGVPRTFGGNPPVSPDVAQGSFSWTSPEGEVIAIQYVADENGYQPTGNAIPQPPEIPAQIARALEYIARYTPPAPLPAVAASAVAKN